MRGSSATSRVPAGREDLEGALVVFDAIVVAVVPAVDAARDELVVLLVGEGVQAVGVPEPAGGAEGDAGLDRDVRVALEVEAEGLAAGAVVGAPRELDRSPPLVARAVARVDVAEPLRELRVAAHVVLH